MNDKHKTPEIVLKVKNTRRARRLAKQLLEEIVPEMKGVRVVIGDISDPRFRLVLALHEFNGGTCLDAGQVPAPSGSRQ